MHQSDEPPDIDSRKCPILVAVAFRYMGVEVVLFSIDWWRCSNNDRCHLAAPHAEVRLLVGDGTYTGMQYVAANTIYLSKHEQLLEQGESMIRSAAHSSSTLASPNTATEAPIRCPRTRTGVNRSIRPVARPSTNTKSPHSLTSSQIYRQTSLVHQRAAFWTILARQHPGVPPVRQTCWASFAWWRLVLRY